MSLSLFSRICLLLSLPLLLLSCGKKEAPQMPTQKVLLAEAVEHEYTPKHSYVAQIKAVSDIKVLPKISGYLEEIAFTEGQLVKKGDLLFRIDDKPYKPALTQAEAQLKSSKASLIDARGNYERGQQLIADNFISQSDLDQLLARYESAKASVDSAEAAIEDAKNNLEYTRITAAFDGRVGRATYAVGDLVSGSDEALTTLTSIDPIRVQFSITEKLYLHSKRVKDEHSVDEKDGRELFQVWVQLNNDYRYPEPGKIDYVGNRVDTNTGTVRIRAELPNPDGFLRPGMNATAVVETLISMKGAFIPRVATQADQQGTYVFVVGDDNVANKRYITLGKTNLNDLIVVDKGIELGERVATKGLQRLRSGQKVEVAEAKPIMPEKPVDPTTATSTEG
ncbi:efflux RND transporter periplasmic adaptor subunit [Agaribacterium sp. ZY112]|uniref:efflux RND transporter periplasmic adaptor subunit n=1 Tax=Agaribacterium sp. ZY112 TaxID=3233574 RepID=UPI00352631C5